jgi:hypothetical protein
MESKLLDIINNEYYNSAWKGHFEFAIWLVKKIKPKIIVELGVDYAHSTFALAGGKEGIIYGIDSFEGDIQAGYRNTLEIVQEMKNKLINEGLINNNIIFIKGYFSEVAKTFNQEIDILHIDGLHSYEAVKEDFYTWITKTNTNGIILFHDVESYPNTVGRLFNEIPYAKYYFSHSAGLGIMCENRQLLDDIMQNPDIPNYNYLHKINGNFIDCYKIFYGLDTNIIDITYQVLYKCRDKNKIIIPCDDTIRAQIFGDPIFGIVKNIIVFDKIRNKKIVYNHQTEVILYI